MRLIIVGHNGKTQNVSLTKGQLWLGGACIVTLIVGLVSAGFFLKQADFVDAAVIASWRTQLSDQKEVVSNLQNKSIAYSQAVGRQISEMQARLWRMEALASHMQKTTGLEDEEFNFDALPAQGGPEIAGTLSASRVELDQQLSLLSQRLERRETELGILDQVLLNLYQGAAATPAGRPITKGWMSSPFGERTDPISGRRAWHEGMDFAGRKGSDVVAVASGVVTFAGRRDGYGNLIEINHGNSIVTRYGHHDSRVVKAGQAVKRGDVIGKMGSSGRSTGPHVHFEVLKNGRPVDPRPYVDNAQVASG